MCTSVRRRMAGISMVELIIFIVVVSIGVVGILPVLNVAVKGSPDPMLRKQAIAIAESLLTEIEQHNFTYCDPNDPAAATASSTAGCTGGAAMSQDKDGVAALGSVNYPVGTSESRGDATNPFDNVADYAGGTFTGDIQSNNLVAGYSATVTITRAGGAAPFNVGTVATTASDALRIQVTVNYPGGNSVTLVGYRFRYAPNSAG